MRPIDIVGIRNMNRSYHRTTTIHAWLMDKKSMNRIMHFNVKLNNIHVSAIDNSLQWMISSVLDIRRILLLLLLLLLPLLLFNCVLSHTWWLTSIELIHILETLKIVLLWYSQRSWLIPNTPHTIRIYRFFFISHLKIDFIWFAVYRRMICFMFCSYSLFRWYILPTQTRRPPHTCDTTIKQTHSMESLRRKRDDRFK